MLKKTTRIHVNKHNIFANRKANNRQHPVFTAKDYRHNRKGNRVTILDDDGNEVAEFVYTPEKPLSCGAVAYLITKNPVEVHEE